MTSKVSFSINSLFELRKNSGVVDKVVMVMVMTTMMKATTLKKMVIIYGDSDEGNDQIS